MSQVKTKVIAFRVSEQDFNTLSELANRLYQMGQVKSQNPNFLAKVVEATGPAKSRY
jgi:hypothetical protein